MKAIVEDRDNFCRKSYWSELFGILARRTSSEFGYHVSETEILKRHIYFQQDDASPHFVQCHQEYLNIISPGKHIGTHLSDHFLELCENLNW